MSYRSILNSRLLPAFGGERLDAIDRDMVLRWFDNYSRGAPIAANQALKLLAGILDRAVRAEVLADNPARRIRYNPKRMRTRFLDEGERGRLLAALDALPRRQRVRALAVKMLLFTGCRSSEIRTLRWDEVGEDVLDLSDGKTGARRVWLGPGALAVLEEAAAMRDAGAGRSEFVFPDPRDPRRCMGRCGISDFWRGIRSRVGLGDVRIHDLRHSYASEAVRRGVPLPVVSRLLGHRRVEMTMRYTHSSNAEVEAAAERIGDRLDSLLRGG